MRTWIKQPTGKNQCGQVAVAVIAGISLEEAIKLVGKKGCTKTKDLVKALRSLGFKCPDKCKRWTMRPPVAIAQLHNPKMKNKWHWVVMDEDRIYDGVDGNPDGTVNWNKNWKLTSYLPITK